MKNINHIIKSYSEINEVYLPLILDLSKKKDQNILNNLHKAKKIKTVSDDYVEQLRELFAVNNPNLVYSGQFESLFAENLKQIQKNQPLEEHGRWVFYAWSGSLSHILEAEEFYRIRTARNRYLIEEKEQQKFYNSVIGIGGLSVGNSVITSIVLQGGGRHVKLADFDRLALSNTNRVRTGAGNLGLKKVVVTARQIFELNPYAKVEVFSEGLNKNNLEKFFSGLNIVIDELDNLSIKYLIREYAKKYRIAVVMGADNGDNAVVDIERYDLNIKTKFFHGRIGNVDFETLAKLDKFGIGKTITQHIGPENITEKMQRSLLAMGKTIVSWPQLGGAAILNGSAVAYCVRKILNGEPLENNRAIVSLDELFVPNYNSAGQKNKRKKIANNFKKMFGLK